MKTVQDVFNAYREGLKNLYDQDELNAISASVLMDIVGFNKAKLKAFPETVLTAGQERKAKSTLIELKTGKPLQYVLGITEFFGLLFKVNPAVLIPRPETEELVQWVIEEVKQSDVAVQNIMDIGTGSGCIPIALKKNLPAINLTAVDISEAALQTARENAKINEVEVEFIQADILDPATEDRFDNRFDIIVSNPPYVTLQDKERMHINVVNFEPHTALFVPENDPLIFYRYIAGFALQKLKGKGKLFLEINESLGPDTVKLLEGKGFDNIILKKDFRGKDRMILASLPV